MDTKDFLESKGIDISQVVSYHYSENERGETPTDGIDIDIESLMEEYAKQKCIEQRELIFNTIDSNHDSYSDIWEILKTVEDSGLATDK